MAHPEQRNFMISVKKRFPDKFINTRVVDFGSLDLNGNNRYLFDRPKEYIGIDIGPGPNVDIVCRAHEYAGEGFDVAISSEMLEHDEYWEKSIQSMINCVKPGGIVVFSCATTGRPEHGTRRTTPQDSPFTSQLDNDYYKNLTEDDIKYKVAMNQFSSYEFQSRDTWPQDLYFWGVKK